MNKLNSFFSKLLYSIDETKWKRITWLVIIFLLISIILPLSILYKFPIHELSIDAWKSNDMDFHFMRIEGLVNALKNFDYPSLVNMFGFSNAGQLVNGTYPWPTLILFAVPRLFISNIPLSYFLSFVLVQFIGLSTFYSLIKYLYNKTSLAIFSSIVFSVFPIYLEEMYERFDIGSFMSYIFSPLIILGVLYIFSSKNTGSILKGSFILAFGLGLVANSHIISLMFAVVGIIIFVIFKFFTKQLTIKRFKYLVIGSIMAMVISIQSWGSVLIITLNQKFVRPYDNVSMNDHSSIGVNLLKGIINDFGNVISGGYSSYHIGIVLLIFGIVFPIVLFVRSHYMDKKIVILFVASMILIFISSVYFPWKLLSNTPIKVIQFPSRLMIPAGIFLTIVVAYVFRRAKTNVLTILSIVTLLIGVSSLQILNRNLETANPKINKRLNDENYSNQLKFTSLPTNSNNKDYKKMAISGKHISNDYYPYDGTTSPDEYNKLTNQVRLSKTNPGEIERKVVSVSSYQNKFVYKTTKAGNVTIPFLKYNFMEYKFTNNGENIEPKGTSKISSFIIPIKKGVNNLTITVQNPSWYKLLAICMWVSIFVLILVYLIFYVFRKKPFLGYDMSNINRGRQKRTITRL